MNAKRQTIWLVSMLSLMVVLSAYYLFTEDVSQPDLQTAQAITDNGITVTTSDSAMTQGSAAAAQDQKAIDQQAAASQQKAADQQKSADQNNAANQQASGDQQKSAATGQKASDQQTAVKTDAQVLQEMQANAASGSGFFASEQLKRSDNLSKQTEQLMKIITDSKQNTDAVSKAYADLKKIEDQNVMVMNLEDSLTKDFPNAFVSQQDNDQWKIIVQSDKLERSQAVSIIDRAISDLNVPASSVSVQYVP